MSGGHAPRAALRGRLLLASASPRRSALLNERGLHFEIEPSDVDESLEGSLEPELAAVLLARRKATEIASRHRGDALWILAADTIVALGQGEELELLPKPADAQEASDMLSSLSGSRHRVVTGVTVINTATFEPGREGGVYSGFERTWVSMREIEPAEILAYVDSGEWRGKAGGYAIQETADAFVLGLEEGGFDNVVGLPVSLCFDLLDQAGAFLDS